MLGAIHCEFDCQWMSSMLKKSTSQHKLVAYMEKKANNYKYIHLRELLQWKTGVRNKRIYCSDPTFSWTPVCDYLVIAGGFGGPQAWHSMALTLWGACPTSAWVQGAGVCWSSSWAKGWRHSRDRHGMVRPHDCCPGWSRQEHSNTCFMSVSEVITMLVPAIRTAHKPWQWELIRQQRQQWGLSTSHVSSVCWLHGVNRSSSVPWLLKLCHVIMPETT